MKVLDLVSRKYGGWTASRDNSRLGYGIVLRKESDGDKEYAVVLYPRTGDILQIEEWMLEVL